MRNRKWLVVTSGTHVTQLRINPAPKRAQPHGERSEEQCAGARRGSGEGRAVRLLPAAFGETVRLGDLVDVDADHGFAETT